MLRRMPSTACSSLRREGAPLKVRKAVSIWDRSLRPVDHAAVPAPRPAAPRTPSLPSYG
jgi:hypothetical protein